MDELLSERWEWYYENRLKHPSEAQEENIRKLDFLLVIKKNGIMSIIEIAIKVLEQAKIYSKDGHVILSYVFATRAEKMMDKMKIVAPSIMNNARNKKLYLDVVEMCQTFKEKAKENIMETLRDDIKEEQEEMKKAEANVRNIEQKIGLDGLMGDGAKGNSNDDFDDDDFDDDLYDDLEVSFKNKEENVEVFDFINDGSNKTNQEANNNKNKEMEQDDNISPDYENVNAEAVVVATDDDASNNYSNVIAIEPGAIVLNDNNNDVLIIEDTNVLEINPDAPPDAIVHGEFDNNTNINSNVNINNSDGVIVATSLNNNTNNQPPPPLYVGSVIPTMEENNNNNNNNNAMIKEERFDTSAFSNLYGNNTNTNNNSPLVKPIIVKKLSNKKKNITTATFVPPPSSTTNTVSNDNKNNNNGRKKQDKFVVKPIQVIEKIKWRVGDKVDIEDVFMSKQGAGVVRKWRKGRVISIKDNRRVKVRYIEPPFNKPKWDENIDMSFEKQKCRIADPGTYTKTLDLQWMSKSERFKVGMRNNGYSIYQMRGDGNCLFRSVAHQIWNDAERHGKLRWAVCEHMLRNRGQFAEVLGALMPGPNGFERYVERMRYPCQGGRGEWGGDPEIRVMEELLDRPIEVWDVEHGPEAPSNIHLEGSLPDYVLNEVSPIRISYHGKNHYNSVIYDKHIHKYPYGLPRTTLIRDFRKKLEREERDARLKNGFK